MADSSFPFSPDDIARLYLQLPYNSSPDTSDDDDGHEERAMANGSETDLDKGQSIEEDSDEEDSEQETRYSRGSLVRKTFGWLIIASTVTLILWLCNTK